MNQNNFLSELAERCSDDGSEVRSYLDDLIKNGELKLEDVLEFFNFACGAYREASRTINIGDSKINIEFNYAARAFASYLVTTDEREKKLALLDAFQAARHIINDSLDIILAEIECQIREAQNISEEKQISDYIDNYHSLLVEKEQISTVVASSRRKRGMFRYKVYLDFINGEPYKKLLQFLFSIKCAIDSLGKQRIIEIKKNRKNLFLSIISLLIASIIALVVALFPDDLKEYGVVIKSFFSNLIQSYFKS